MMKPRQLQPAAESWSAASVGVWGWLTFWEHAEGSEMVMRLCQPPSRRLSNTHASNWWMGGGEVPSRVGCQ